MTAAKTHKQKTILLTRDAGKSLRLAEHLRAQGALVLQAPLLVQTALSPPPPVDFSGISALLFTSAAAPEFSARLAADKNLPVFAVGSATAKAAQEAGFKTIHTANGDSHAAASLLLAKKEALGITHVLHLCGMDVAQDIAPALAAGGIALTRKALYKAEPVDTLPPDIIRHIASDSIDTIVFFSARAAAHFVELAQKSGLEAHTGSIEAVCLSPRIAEPLRKISWQAIRITPRPDGSGLEELLAANPGDDKDALSVQKWQTANSKNEDKMTEKSTDPKKPNGTPERRRGEDRRHSQAPRDKQGRIKASTYAGPDRRTGEDRRAYLARQQRSINDAKWAFLNRTVLMTAFLFILVVLAAVFVMAPEYIALKERSLRVETVEAQMASLQEKLNSLQSAQAQDISLSAKINDQLDRLQSATEAAATKVETITEAAKSGLYTADNTNVTRFLKILSDANLLSRSDEGQQALQTGTARLKAVLDGWQGDEKSLNDAVAVAQAQDPTLAVLLQGIAPKDLGAAAMLLVLNEFRGNVSNQRPFGEDLALVQKFAANDPEMRQSLQKLAPYAQNGVLSRSALQQEFKGLAMDIVMAKLEGEDLSLQHKARKRMENLVRVRRVDDVTGTSPDAVVARAHILLDQGDIQGAVRELQSLEGAPAQKAAPWMAQAEGTLAANDAATKILNGLLLNMSTAQGFSLEGLISSLNSQIDVSLPDLTPPGAKQSPAFPALP